MISQLAEQQPPAAVSKRTYTVYVQPGCSSCLRTKEYLARHGIDFRVVDVMNDAEGFEELRKLGLRHVPVVACGSEYVYGQNIDDVARFTGVGLATNPRLAPQDLMDKWLQVLDIAASYVRQMPLEQLDKRPVPNRDGTTKALGLHVFMIAQAFIDAVENNRPDWIENSMQPPPANIQTGDDVAEAGLRIRRDLLGFWERRKGISAGDTVMTFQGEQSLHWFLERSTWHSAQHTRQLADVLARLQIPMPISLTSDLLAGLPLPERIWE